MVYGLALACAGQGTQRLEVASVKACAAQTFILSGISGDRPYRQASGELIFALGKAW
jgi:hypothetical protein